MDLDTHDNPKGDRIASPPYRVRYQHTPSRLVGAGDGIYGAHESKIYVPGPRGPRKTRDFCDLPSAVEYAASFGIEYTVFLEHQYEPGGWMVLPKNPGLRAWS